MEIQFLVNKMKTIIKIALISLLAIGVLTQTAFAYTSTVKNFYTVKDTFYGTTFSKGPNDTAVTLNGGGWGDRYDIYIEWDLSAMPSPEKVSTVKACFKVASSPTNNPTNYIRVVTGTWSAPNVTSTNYPAITTTGQVAMSDPRAIGVGNYDCINITTIYTSWMNGTQRNYGIAIVPTNISNTAFTYHSSNAASAANYPYLEITYTSHPATFHHGKVTIPHSKVTLI